VFVVPDRATEIAFGLKGIASAIERLRMMGIQLQSLVEILDGKVTQTFLPKRLASVSKGLGEVRIQPDRLIEVKNSSIEFPLETMSDASIVEGYTQIVARFLSRLNERRAAFNASVRVFVLASPGILVARWASQRTT
jgi:hypothetical protein